MICIINVCTLSKDVKYGKSFKSFYFLFLCHQIDETEKCHLGIIDFHVKNKCVFDVMWYGPFMLSAELYRPEFVKIALKGQPERFVVFRFEIKNMSCHNICRCGLQSGKLFVSTA